MQKEWHKSQACLPSRGGLDPLNYYQKAETDDIEALFQLGTNPWEQAGSEMINDAMQAFALAPESESQLTNSAEVHKDNRVLKSGKRTQARTVYRTCYWNF